MLRKVGVASALLSAVTLMVGCGEVRVGSGDSPPAAPSDSASTLTISCSADATAVDETRVSAGPSGLSVRLIDSTESGLVALMQNVTTKMSTYAYGPPHHSTVEVGPGPYAVRCVDMDEPEHSESAVDSDESQRVEVLAAADVWTPQREPSCVQGMHSVRDFAPMGEADPQLRTQPAEPVVRADREVSGWLRDSDELVTTGYRDSERRRVEVVRAGEVVGVVSLFLGPGGWIIGSIDACDI